MSLLWWINVALLLFVAPAVCGVTAVQWWRTGRECRTSCSICRDYWVTVDEVVAGALIVVGVAAALTGLAYLAGWL